MKFKTTLFITSVFLIVLYMLFVKHSTSNVKELYSGIDMNDILLVADTGNNRILSGNNYKWDEFGSKDIQFSSPRDIVVYKHKVYIIDCGNNRIVVLDNKGNFIRHWGSFGWCYKECGRKNDGASSCTDGKFNAPRGITILNDEVYVSDKCNHRIQVFDLKGNFKRKWGSFGSTEGTFNTPLGIATYENEIYVTDAYNSRVQVFSSDGTFQRMWGAYGSKHGAFDSPVKIAAYKNNIYVSERNNHRIQVFDTKGNFLRLFGTYGSTPDSFKQPYGLCVYQDKVYIADSGNHRIQIFNTNGTFVNTWGNRGVCQNKILRKYFKRIMPLLCDEFDYYGPMGVAVISGEGALSNEFQFIK